MFMDYKDLFIQNIHILRELIFFRREDLPEINEVDFNKWITDWLIVNQYADIYSLPKEYVELTKTTRYFLMHKYFENSYISGRSALDDYWACLSWNVELTLMTNKDVDKAELVVWNESVFVYKTYVENYSDFVSQKPIELWNKAMWLRSKCCLNIASLELALVDLFSTHKYVMDLFDFDKHWLYWERLDAITDREKLLKIAESTQEEFIINSTKKFITWLTNKEYKRIGLI